MSDLSARLADLIRRDTETRAMPIDTRDQRNARHAALVEVHRAYAELYRTEAAHNQHPETVTWHALIEAAGSRERRALEMRDLIVTTAPDQEEQPCDES